MRKILKNKTLLALTLAASFASVGCTTNLNRGNGEPATGSTSATAPSATPGSSGGTVPQSMPPSMTSSSRLTNTPAEALAVMQQSLPTVSGRVLGPVNPPNTGIARTGGNAATPIAVAPSTVSTSAITSTSTWVMPRLSLNRSAPSSSALSVKQTADGKFVITNKQ